MIILWLSWGWSDQGMVIRQTDTFEFFIDRQTDRQTDSDVWGPNMQVAQTNHSLKSNYLLRF